MRHTTNLRKELWTPTSTWLTGELSLAQDLLCLECRGCHALPLHEAAGLTWYTAMGQMWHPRIATRWRTITNQAALEPRWGICMHALSNCACQVVAAPMLARNTSACPAPFGRPPSQAGRAAIPACSSCRGGGGLASFDAGLCCHDLQAAQGALDSGHKNNIQNTSARHDAMAAATADGVKRAQESAQQSAQQVTESSHMNAGCQLHMLDPLWLLPCWQPTASIAARGSAGSVRPACMAWQGACMASSHRRGLAGEHPTQQRNPCCGTARPGGADHRGCGRSGFQGLRHGGSSSRSRRQCSRADCGHRLKCNLLFVWRSERAGDERGRQR